ncbi:hypothetical protein [Qipengyuania marisflavi]|uniref:Uncharacterized protein n=1 Tax=Qipengyuania marisflavi TaxID=2486356 RepID=A0A5S3PAL6_9SPHN|nr:hypothetical protein [Qipengyuania marisflavi]TMM50413.1 hypothetical protein FEV51_04375 [Qipengyuania marisflavi]
MMRSRTALAVLTLGLTLSACKPPAADDYIARTRITDRAAAPSEPIGSPDVEGAIWAPGRHANRVLYGIPGQQPLMALECLTDEARPMFAITRFALADQHAQGILALIGNGRVERLFVDAAPARDVFLWHGEVPAADPRLDVFIGAREVEATIPGAGSVVLHPSNLPRTLIEQCRGLQQTAPVPPADPA